MGRRLPIARAILRAGSWPQEREVGRVTLRWEERCRRRARLTLDGAGAPADILLDLAHSARLVEGDGLALEDGGVVRIAAAAEAVLEIRAETTDLTRIAYHLGNRHLPLEISPGLLIAPNDPVAADMARRLGGEAHAVERPFNPEPGAYDHHERPQPG